MIDAMTTMHRLTVAVGALVIAGSALFGAPTAHADPDPHIPDPQTSYCPGGGMGSMIWYGYCDGEHYPDGTYWHWFQQGIPTIGHPAGLLGQPMECVVDNGTPMPPPAPPDGCGR